MKKTIFTSILILAAHLGMAQEQPLEDQKPQVENKNMVKLNLLALSAGNISLQYERLITPKNYSGCNGKHDAIERFAFFKLCGIVCR